MTDIDTTGPDPKAGGTVSLGDLAKSALSLTEPGQPAMALPAFPRPMVDVALRMRLRAAADAFGTVELAEGQQRPLTDEELEKLTAEAVVLTSLADPLKKRIDAIRETIRVHKDAQASRDGRKAPQDAKGHFILASPGNPDETDVPGMNLRWAQEYTSGTVNVSQAKLEELLAAGEITRTEYLAVTRQVRVLDTVRVQDYMRKSPKAATRLLRRITEIGPARTSLSLRKKKG